MELDRNGALYVTSARGFWELSNKPVPGKKSLTVETEYPDDEQLQAWVFDGDCEATDGCCIEPDGICEHGHPSWLLAIGII